MPVISKITGAPFRFWCQKILPAVYDDSLSYYELLCKVVDYLNKVMEDDINVVNLVNELEEFVNNYFDNLDVQEEINNKLDTMAEDGSLLAVVAPHLNEIIAQYEATLDEDLAEYKDTIDADITEFKGTVNDELNAQDTDIVNFKNTVNGQVSTQNTEITNFKSTVNEQISTQNANISQQDNDISVMQSQMNNFIQNHSGELTFTELYSTTEALGAHIVNETFDLSDDYTKYPELDIYWSYNSVQRCTRVKTSDVIATGVEISFYADEAVSTTNVAPMFFPFMKIVNGNTAHTQLKIDSAYSERWSGASADSASRNIPTSAADYSAGSIIKVVGVAYQQDAEVLDIRVGYDSTVYPTAGDAVRGQFSELRNAFNSYLVNENEGKQSFYGLGNFQHYGISTDGEFITNQKYRVSNNDPMMFNRDLKISVATGFRWGYITYENETWGSWTGWYTNDRVIKSGTSFIVQIARVTEDTSEIANVTEFLNAVTFETVTAINTRRIAESGISSVDIKSYLGIEIGGLTYEGKDNNYMPWRLRSLLNILPYDITITKNNGYQFKVYTFSDADMNNPVDSGWYITDGATLNIQKNTYFRVMFVDSNNDLANIDIIDVENSSIYNNCFVYRTDWIYSTLTEAKPLIPKVNAIKSFNPCFVSMAHQGYSTTAQYHGNDRISSYIGAFKKGFDTAETDVQFSSDNVPVCCHDASFTDSVSGSTIIIAEHTAEELQTYNYYGEHIATLDEVMSVCKTYGLRLELDKVLPSWTDIQWNAVFDVVSKYQMQKYVLWTLPYNTNATLNKILAYDKYATVILNLQNADLISNYVTWIRSVITDDCTIILALLRTIASVDDIINLNKTLTERNIGVMVWTIDDLATYRSYAPYVWGIASNKLSIKDVIFEM